MFGKYDAFIVSSPHNDNLGKREGIPMSICFSGLDTPCCVHPVLKYSSPLKEVEKLDKWKLICHNFLRL